MRLTLLGILEIARHHEEQDHHPDYQGMNLKMQLLELLIHSQI